MTTTFDRTSVDPATQFPNGTGGADILTLRAFAPGGLRAGCPAATASHGDLVVLGYSPDDAERVDVHTRHGATSLPAETPAVSLDDAQARADLLQDAVRHLADRLRDVRADLTCVTGRHARTLADIRRYAIDKHLDDVFCRDGLNTFLRTFDLPPYEPRVRLSYTITGNYEVDADDSYQAERDARGYLKPDLSEIDQIIDDSDSFTVEITQSEALDS